MIRLLTFSYCVYTMLGRGVFWATGILEPVNIYEKEMVE
jgi:hypothetical protein